MPSVLFRHAAPMVGLGLLVCAAFAHGGSAPELFAQPAYESPVRGDPDDLMHIAGTGLSAGDTVVYEAVVDTTKPPAHPASIPKTSTAGIGIADLVNVSDAPHSLTVHLPQVMIAGNSYALWVTGADGQWSAPVLINDARPLWITTDSAFQTATLANLPRTLTVVGRNLQPVSGRSGRTQVRLSGRSGVTYVLMARKTAREATDTAAADRYTAVVNLPPRLAVGQYRVLLSRDGQSWVPLLGNGQDAPQLFTVRPDPGGQKNYRLRDFALAANSPCLPNDGVDDTKCILLAIRAAAAVPGGATVVFDPGVWRMSNPGRWPPGSGTSDTLEPSYCTAHGRGACGVTYDGILVPPGVSLLGAGSDGPGATTIERGAGWVRTSTAGTDDGTLPGFTLQGNNRVSGFIFTDATDYRIAPAGGPALQLGLVWYRARLYGGTDPLAVSNVVISKNQFDKPYVAIGNGGLPIDHVYITYNLFGGAYRTAVSLEQDPNEVRNLLPSALLPYQTYHFNDSVINYNVFYPSSWNYTKTSGSYGYGTIATQISSGLRTDFSNNVADGTSTRYLYDPTADAKGWRAAHFWSTGSNQEMTLVSNNSVTCPGDKNGDGEAFAFDGSMTLGGLPRAEPVISAASSTDAVGDRRTTLTLEGPLVTALHDPSHVDISGNPTPYYRGFWVQIVAGTGKGQWRRLKSVALGTGSMPTVTLSVSPAFDVLPDRNSVVAIGHAYWQNVTVDNTVDQRSPPCTKANTYARGGGMTWYDSTADSALDGNRLYDAGGMFIHQNYAPSQPSGVLVPANITLQSANEIRGNVIDGVYNRSKPDSSGGGIQLGYGAVDRYCAGTHCVSAAAPPELGLGIIIAGNNISAADSQDPMDSNHWPTGAISLTRDWSTGPTDASGLVQWPLGDDTLIFHNTLQGISATAPGTLRPGEPRIGIGIDPVEHGKAYSQNAWRSTLYANHCAGVDNPVSDTGIGTVRYCPVGATDTCECRGQNAVNVSVAASASESGIEVGAPVTFTVTVTNDHELLAAHGVALIVEPPAGIRIAHLSLNSGTGFCDSSTNVCLLGPMSHGQSAAIRVAATALAAGMWDTTFSVTHREPDSAVVRSGATVSTLVSR